MGMRKCSKCGKTGHNSRTCRNASSNCGKIMRLFGVELAKFDYDDNEESKLSNSSEAEIISSSSSEEDLKQIINGATTQGQRKKGIPWSEEEHTLFLLGLEKLGKGNWRGISRNFVTTRTSTQVASHAQKHFLRINNNSTKINKFTPTILSMVPPNEVRKLPESPYFCRLFNNSAVQNSLSLELSLAAPPSLPSPVWERLPVMLWKKQYVVKNI